MAWLQTTNQDPLAGVLDKFTNNTDISDFEDEVIDVITAGKYTGPYPWNVGEGKRSNCSY